MKFLITGGTGLVGSSLINLLIENGHSVNVLSRKKIISNKTNLAFFLWNPSKQFIDRSCVIGVDTIINLAGSSVLSVWSKSVKNNILQSRIDSLQTIYNLLKKNKHNVKRIISASAIGIYQNNSIEIHDENTREISNSFLGKTVFQWESKINGFNKIKINVSVIRIGLVISKYGGMFKVLKKLNKLRISTLIDGGIQRQSWIHIDDLVHIFYFIAKNNINGVINAVSPKTYNFKEILKFISNINKKPLLIINLPGFIPQFFFKILGLSDFYYDIIISNKNVSSKKIQDLGYKFIHPSLTTI